MNVRRLAGAALWVTGLLAAAAALQWAGEGPLATPPLTEPGRWPAWLEDRDPVMAAFALLRVGALGGLWYLAGITLLGTVLRVVGAASLIRVTDRFTIGPVRRMLAGSVSLGLAASGVLAVAAPAMRLPVAVAQTSTTSTTAVTPAPPATVTMHRLGPAEGPAPVAPAGLVAQVPTPAPAPASAERRTLVPGESFWSIAEDVLAARLGRAPTDAEIVPYWQRLIEANRSELAHRDNPDLIFPAQSFVIPAP
jgi:hypothetical protein